MPMTSKFCQRSSSSDNSLQLTAVLVILYELKVKTFFHQITYLSWVEIWEASYLLSAANLTDKHFLPEISNLLTRRRSSVLLPANMGPMMISILPLCFIFNNESRCYLSEFKRSYYFLFKLMAEMFSKLELFGESMLFCRLEFVESIMK